jgi:type II secretory pathway pseudopilin PulG
MRHKLTKDSRGFTLIELMIILVSVGILIAIIAYTYSGIQARSINTKQETAIRTLQTSIEKFYSINMYYPSLANINNSAWRTTNMPKLNNKMLQGPSWTVKDTACTVNGQAILLSRSQPGCFGYNPTNNGSSCTRSDKTCNEYMLSATLDQSNKRYTLHQLD